MFLLKRVSSTKGILLLKTLQNFIAKLIETIAKLLVLAFLIVTPDLKKVIHPIFLKTTNNWGKVF